MTQRVRKHNADFQRRQKTLRSKEKQMRETMKNRQTLNYSDPKIHAFTKKDQPPKT